ncbi:MAG: DNA repair protein RecN [Clostridia bacterium]|nr:DNA repair protein RecN [Clostridia bacterium]
MLLQLDIQNIALIDRISIELGKGLNALTGETGAGKSIIIDSINAILGGRVSRDLIRNGKDKAVVEAVFQIDKERVADLFEELGLEYEEDGTLILSREFNQAGKNTCRVNGKLSTVSMLKEIGERIIDVHGQHDNQSLLRTDSHIELLDLFAGEQIEVLKEEYLNTLAKYKEVKNKIKGLAGDQNDRVRKIDLLKFQIDEIEKAKLKAGEEEELLKQRLILSSAEKIISALASGYEWLYGGNKVKNSAFDSITACISELNGIARIDEKFGELSKKLEEISYQLDDCIETIRKERDDIEYSPELLESVEERIDLIYRMKKKYGNSVEEVLRFCAQLENELDEILQSGEIIEKLQKEKDKLNDTLFAIAKRMSEERVKAAALLESEIGAELDELEMKKAQFKTSIEFDDSIDGYGDRKYFETGLDKVEFLIAPNAGEPLKPLSKIASGGEMSRIMLAIKTILANVDRVPTLIFDEIDIGISGRAAQKVAEKLSFISGNHQVLCVTHLSQIACMSDRHYLIEKISDEDHTKTEVRLLEREEVKSEIARIIGGASISNITLKHAEELLKSANQFKKELRKSKK